MTSESPRILIAGMSGLIGSALLKFWRDDQGWRVGHLARDRGELYDGDVYWNARKGEIDDNALLGVDVVVNLAGESLAAGRWTEDRKKSMRESRIEGTKFLAESLAKLNRPPRLFIVASAIGYYGDAGDTELDEDSPAGEGYLAELCRDWETAADPARDAGIRVVHSRFGMVLSTKGGALKKMLPAFNIGMGGPIGSGRQWMSWIHIADVVGALHHIVTEAHDIRGPANIVSPEPVRNRDFAKTLGSALHRPALVPAPAPALRLMFGEMVDEALLASQRVVPKRLTESGYTFRFPSLAAALDDLVK